MKLNAQPFSGEPSAKAIVTIIEHGEQSYDQDKASGLRIYIDWNRRLDGVLAGEER
jgi:hypothetical protein